MELFDNAFWNAVITAIISAIITNLCLWWHKKADYKRDYYKKIVDKRIKAYEVVEKLIARLDKTAILENDNRKFLECCYPMGNTKKFFEEMGEVEKYRLWLEQDCRECLDRINVKMTPFYAFYSTNEINMSGKRLSKAVEVCSELEKERDKLRQIVKKNIVKLHDVDSFFNN